MPMYQIAASLMRRSYYGAELPQIAAPEALAETRDVAHGSGAMDRWTEVVGWLASVPVIERTERALVLELRVDQARVRIRAERVTAFEEDWLLMFAPIMRE